MRLAALFSGGKDSTFSIYLAKQAGHEVKYLATVVSANPDSFMYHTPNIGMTFLQSQCLGIQLVSKRSSGEKEKEVDDLKKLLKGLQIEGVLAGAIASKYQNERVKKVCDELSLKTVTPLWGMDQGKLLKKMIEAGFEIILTAVAAEGLGEKWLGRKVDLKALKELKQLKKKYGINIAGEGGEYESAVLNCPLFKRRIEITDSEKVWDKKTNSGKLLIKDAKLVKKE
ncbi:TIGR00289 family protein [bacterium]|nr:MAG: TIGR00289 family protein [bacterium]